MKKEELPRPTILPGHVRIVSAVTALHCERLSSTSLSIGKHCAIIPLHHLQKKSLANWGQVCPGRLLLFFKKLKETDISRNLANKRLDYTLVHLQLLTLDSKDFVKLECFGKGGCGLLLDGDLLGIGGVDHAVRALRLFIVIEGAAP